MNMTRKFFFFISAFVLSGITSASADSLLDSGMFVTDRDTAGAFRSAGVEGVRPTVTGIIKGSKADKAGIRSADIILLVDGRKIYSVSDLRAMNVIPMKMEVLRNRQILKTGEPEAPKPAIAPAVSGVVVPAATVTQSSASVQKSSATTTLPAPAAVKKSQGSDEKKTVADDSKAQEKERQNDITARLDKHQKDITSSQQKVRMLTLMECLQIASEKNRDIKKAREYANTVQGRYVEERAAALPQMSFDAGISYAKDMSTKVLYGTANVQSLRTADINLTQPVFTWGKLSAAIRAAELGVKTADQHLRIYRQRAFRDVSVAFYDVLLAKELHRLAVENLSQKLRHQIEALKKFSAGVATDYDTLAAGVEVENAVPEVIKMANNIRTRRENLRFLLGIDQEDVDAKGEIKVTPEQPESFEETLSKGIEKRPELLDQILRVGIYEELVNIAATGNKPRLDLRGGGGWRQMELSNPGPVARSDGPAWNVGLYLTFPFFDGFRTSGKVQQARSELKTSQIEKDKLKDSIALEIRTAHYSLNESAEIIKALSGTVNQARRLLDMSEKGYRYGVKTKLDVDDAETNLIRAQYSHIRAMRDYLAAQVNLKWAMGVLGEQ